MKTLALLLIFASAVFAAAPDLNKPIPELKLSNGRVLKNVQIISYASSALMAKWEGGRGTLKYEDFPDEYQPALAAERPKPSNYVAPPPAPKPLAAAPTPATPVTPSAPATVKVEGRCYITTAGAGAYRMSGVEILIFPGKVIGAFDTNISTIDLPPPITTVITDVEGAFSVELPRATGPWLIVAQGMRRVGSIRGSDPWERYEWIVPLGIDATKVLLGSDNHHSRPHLLRIAGR